jgi:hypothetical protein
MNDVEEFLESIEKEKVYDYEDAQKVVASFSVDPQLLSSLYYFDIDCMKNVVRGVHLYNLIAQKHNEKG